MFIALYLGARARQVKYIISFNLHNNPIRGLFSCLSDEATHSETLSSMLEFIYTSV